MASTNYQRIHEVVKRIPRGCVATYGQVAALAGMAGHARQVGYALHALTKNSGVPWHRVINARGEVSKRAEPMFEEIQRTLLKKEGVVANDKGMFSLKQYLWRSK
jgi:methylated-DNA-protein-cysteine methyltransferase-like protein